MKFELRALKDNFATPIVLAVQGGPVVPGQVGTEITYKSEAESISSVRIVLDLVVLADLPLRVAEASDQSNDLAEASLAFWRLSPENRKRFATMYAEELREAMPLKDDPRLIRVGTLSWSPSMPWYAGNYTNYGFSIPEGDTQARRVYAMRDELAEDI